MSPAAMTPDIRERAMALLRAAVARSSVAAVARRLGYSRPAVTMVLGGTYAGRPDTLLARALDRLTARRCPHLGTEIPSLECAQHRSRPMPTGSRSAFRHWQACRACPHGDEAHGDQGGGDAE